MVIRIDLPTEDTERLEAKARDLGLPLEDYARKALKAIAQEPTDDFRAMARRLLDKNAELLRRLA